VSPPFFKAFFLFLLLFYRLPPPYFCPSFHILCLSYALALALPSFLLPFFPPLLFRPVRFPNICEEEKSRSLMYGCFHGRFSVSFALPHPFFCHSLSKGVCLFSRGEGGAEGGRKGRKKGGLPAGRRPPYVSPSLGHIFPSSLCSSFIFTLTMKLCFWKGLSLSLSLVCPKHLGRGKGGPPTTKNEVYTFFSTVRG
jgi:hypothetical protein